MLGNSTGLPSKFSHKAAITLAEFAMTQNVETQAFAVDGVNAENVQTTGTGQAILKGHPITVAEDAELDISGDLQLTTWLTATAYTTVDLRFTTDANGHKQWYKCILNHTSSAADKPGFGANWRTYWIESTNRAEQASGDVVASGDSMYYLALVNSAGTLTLVKASDSGVLDANIELKIPQFDPEVFVAIGTLLIDSAGFTLGTTSTAGVSTFAQILGPVFPHPDYLDRN